MISPAGNVIKVVVVYSRRCQLGSSVMTVVLSFVAEEDRPVALQHTVDDKSNVQGKVYDISIQIIHIFNSMVNSFGHNIHNCKYYNIYVHVCLYIGKY